MEIKNTYIVYSNEHNGYVKMYRCADPDGIPRFFIESNNGVLTRISFDDFNDLLEGSKI